MSQEKSLTCLPFPPSSLLRSQRSRPRSRPRGPADCCTKMASAPSCTCCLARRAPLPELCMLSCARQGPAKASPSVSHPPAGPVWAIGVSAAQGWWPALGGNQDILRARPGEYSQGGRGQYFGFETARRAGDLFLSSSGLSFPLQVSSRTSPSTIRSMGSSSAPTCVPPRHHPPPPQAAPPLWPTGLCKPPSRRATEHLNPLPASLHPLTDSGQHQGHPLGLKPTSVLLDFSLLSLIFFFKLVFIFRSFGFIL